jgi:hypothetical protein
MLDEEMYFRNFFSEESYQNTSETKTDSNINKLIFFMPKKVSKNLSEKK